MNWLNEISWMQFYMGAVTTVSKNGTQSWQLRIGIERDRVASKKVVDSVSTAYSENNYFKLWSFNSMRSQVSRGYHVNTLSHP